MDRRQLQNILQAAADMKIVAVGDFFLDQYLFIDPSVAERSRETGNTAHQVTAIRSSPGAAGNVVRNLSALGVGQITIVGITGRDGAGFELRRALEALADTTYLLADETRMTSAYIKPTMVTDRGLIELDRFDQRERQPLPTELVQDLGAALTEALTTADGVVVTDQIEAADSGVMQPLLRRILHTTALHYRKLPIIVDSRAFAKHYSRVILKMNEAEARQTIGSDTLSAGAMAAALCRQTGRPAVITLGVKGLVACTGSQTQHIPGIIQPEPVDSVGAGDTISAALVAALCAGADLFTAAAFANLAASVTVTKLGDTGAPSPEELLAAAARLHQL